MAVEFKFRFIKIMGKGMFFCTNTLVKEDLVRAKQGYYEDIIDLENGCWYNAETNTWELLDGDKV